MKTALITGGSRGIGRACVDSFVREGYRVAFLYRQDRDAAERLRTDTGAIPFCCDVSDSDQVVSTVHELLREFLHIDVLVNNAGIAQQKLFCDITPEEWQHMIRVNLGGAYACCHAVIPGMVSRKFGRIINIGSIWGQVGGSCEVHYSAAKAGLIGMTRALAKELAPSGITVNCVCPGVIQTDMMASFSEEDLKLLREETPVGRIGTPEDVAEAVLFFAGEKASFITGQILGVNGGFGE